MKRTLSLTLNPKLARYVKALQDSGFFGVSPEDVCERLICQGIERIVMGPEANPLRASLNEVLMEY